MATRQQQMQQYQRELERQQREAAKAIRQAALDAERARKEYERAAVAEEKERKRLYLESRVAEVESKNDDLESYVEALGTLLKYTLERDDFLDFERLKSEPDIPEFDPAELAVEESKPLLRRPVPQGGLKGVLPGAKAKFQAAFDAAEAEHQRDLDGWRAREESRQLELRDARRAYEQAVEKARSEAEERSKEIDEFRLRFEAGEPTAIVDYFSLVLDASDYPGAFEKHYRVAYDPDSKLLAIEYRLPDSSVVPTVKQFRYNRAKDTVEESARLATAIKSLYASIVAQFTLRTLHEVFEADRAEFVDTTVFNGYVETINPATGQNVKPHLVTVRVTRDVFSQLDLAHVEPLACLKGLNASVSKSPSELVPVRPVLEFDMVDPRFVQASDVMATLDQRPNLMELSPNEFESLITNLFQSMGLETRQTQASRDGGVDCVAFDPRPIFGGKVVIQAKRYKNTVGVSAVRDLFGTMQNEGASKGILVTTSGYGKSSFEFAEGKPIELLSGSNLLALLAQYAHIEAKIVPPDDWKDIEPDY